MSNYSCMTGVEPKWLSKFLGHRDQTIMIGVLLMTIPLFTGRILDLLFACGAFVGLVLSPDLDLSYNRLGLFGIISFAHVYTKLVPHRTSISHTPLLGTFVRAIVVLVPFGIIICLMTGLTPGFGVVVRLFIGLAWADAWHWVLDWVSSNMVVKRSSYGKRASR